MKKIAIFILLALAVLSSCQRDENITPDSDESAVTIELNIPPSLNVETKATAADKVINNLWVFTFDSSNKLTSKSKATINDTKANVTLPNGTGINIYVCANVNPEEEAIFGNFIELQTTLADLQAMTMKRVNTPGLTMSGQALNQTIKNTTTTIAIDLNRLVARIDIILTPNSKLKFESIAKILNTADGAPIFTGDISPVPGNATDATVNLSSNWTYVYENAITASTEEEAEKRATAIIIRGKYNGITGYYKLRVNYGSPVGYNINRNTIYSINISAVNAPGFATAAEAEANKPQNVEYDITVTDPNAYDTFVSNGQYYLASTNSACIIKGGSHGVNVKIATIKHPVVDKSLVSDGTITASTGIKIVGSTVLSSASETHDIVISINNGYRSGTITVRWGNLMTVINVTIDFAKTGTPISRYSISGDGYCRAEVQNNARWVWLGEAANNHKKITGDFDFKNTLYITLENVRNTKEYPRATEILVRSTNNRGTTKLILMQYPNVYNIGLFAGWKTNNHFTKILGVDSENEYSYYTWRASTSTPNTKAYDRYIGANNITELRKISGNSNLTMHPPARFCLMKNDLSGNGSIEDDEPLDWYLPAQSQLIGLLVTFQAILPVILQPSNIWSSTEESPTNGISIRAFKLNPTDPYTSSAAMYTKDNDRMVYVRCVRDLDA